MGSSEVGEEQDRLVRWVYLEEVRNQASMADLGRQDINAQLSAEHGERAMDRLFLGVQTLVNAAAMISKLLWPTGKALDEDYGHLTQHRAAYLRSSLQVNDHSPLRTRAIRNALEHFDERMDKWVHEEVQSAKSIVFADRHIGSPSSIVVDGQTYRPLRYIDPGAEGILVGVLDETIALQPLFDEIQRVWKRAEEELGKVQWP